MEHMDSVQKLVAKWKRGNPLFNEMQEYGRLLTRHIDSYSKEERLSFNELHQILHKNNL